MCYTIISLIELYVDGHDVIKMACLLHPLSLSLTPSKMRIARRFLSKLEAIGVELMWRDGEILITTLPTVLLDDNGHHVVSVSVIQVNDNMYDNNIMLYTDN